ncbi:MAG: uracil-DNA glycosylase [Elusimicrobiota bacterium]
MDAYFQFKKNLIESHCSKCTDLCSGRTNIVVDRGNPAAKIMIIGEAPGANEDLTGQAFVGRGGKLLDALLSSVGIQTNTDTIIANVVKCRPPNNRPPTQAEADHCLPYLKEQINLVKPKVILLLGATAAKHLIPEHKDKSMKERVGKFFDLPEYPQIKFQILFHPAYILRDPRKKKDMLEHLGFLKEMLEKSNG